MELKDRTRWAINFIAKKEKLSNPKIGKIIGVKADTVNSYRSKLANPKVDFIIKFCDTFGIDLLWFTKGDGEPFPGASAKFPEVCAPSRYETQTHSAPQPQESTNAHFQGATSVETDTAEKYIAINSTEKSLVDLCKLIGLPIERGWKSTLADYFKITPAQLSNSISRNRLSKNLLIRIEEKGFPTDNWLVPPETDDVTAQWAEAETIAAEISFQKLALLAGIKIDGNWIVNLSKFLEMEPWHLGMAIHNDRIDANLLHLIEKKGYARQRWTIKREQAPESRDGDPRPSNNAELLKMAESILQSGTAHATSLAMSIISLNTAVAADKKK